MNIRQTMILKENKICLNLWMKLLLLLNWSFFIEDFYYKALSMGNWVKKYPFSIKSTYLQDIVCTAGQWKKEEFWARSLEISLREFTAQV